MKHKNTMTKNVFLWKHLLWSFPIFWAYRNSVFYPLPNHDFVDSMVALAILNAVLLFFGIGLTSADRRNDLSLFLNLFAAYGVYFAVSFWNLTRWQVAVALTAAVLLAVGYPVLVLRNYVRDRALEQGVSLPQVLMLCFHNVRALISGVLLILVLTVGGGALLGFPLLEAPETKTTVQVGAPLPEARPLEENRRTLLLLREDAWPQLTAEERLGVMKTVSDTECAYLGLSGLTVNADMLQYGTLGAYRGYDKTITLDLLYLMEQDADTILRVVLHEVYHAYQHHLVQLRTAAPEDLKNLRILEAAQVYEYEFANYQDAYEDYDAYDNQRCEVDCDNYAEEIAPVYLEFIAETP